MLPNICKSPAKPRRIVFWTVLRSTRDASFQNTSSGSSPNRPSIHYSHFPSACSFCSIMPLEEVLSFFKQNLCAAAEVSTTDPSSV